MLTRRGELEKFPTTKRFLQTFDPFQKTMHFPVLNIGNVFLRPTSGYFYYVLQLLLPKYDARKPFSWARQLNQGGEQIPDKLDQS